MKLESLKNGKFATQTLSPEMMRLVNGGETFETTHIPTNSADTSKYSKCGTKGEWYDMQVSLNSTGELVIQGMGTERFKDTQEWWYK